MSNENLPLFKKFNAKDSFLQKFQEKGYSPTDIPKAIVFHELLGTVLLGLTWSLCYIYPLTQISFLRIPVERIKATMPVSVPHALSSNEFINSPLGISYLEAACLRRLLRPATVPAKVYLTFKMIDVSRDFQFTKVRNVTSWNSIGVNPLFPSLRSHVIKLMKPSSSSFASCSDQKLTSTRRLGAVERMERFFDYSTVGLL
jgi:hypothetical protein